MRIGHRGTLGVLVWLVAMLGASTAFGQDAEPVSGLNSGDNAWILTSSAIVLMMTIPGLALFYGGLVRTQATCCRC